MLDNIKLDLGDNYTETTDELLQQIIDDVTANALFISNRANTEDNVDFLAPEIKECVKVIYMQRGVEETKSASESGRSLSLKDAIDELRMNIVKNGKRLLY